MSTNTNSLFSSAPSCLIGLSFSSEPKPSESLAFSFCESHLHPSSPTLRNKDGKDDKGTKSPSAFSPNFSESKDSLSPHCKPRSKDRHVKPHDSASPSALGSRQIRRSRSAEYSEFGSKGRKLNDLSKTKEEPHKSHRSKENRQQHKQDSSRHTKFSKQQPKKSSRKSNQERQEGVTNEMKETLVIQNNDMTDCIESSGRDHSRGRQQNKDRWNSARKKAGTNGHRQGAGCTEPVEPQNTLSIEKQPQEQHDRSIGKSRKTKRHGDCEPRREHRVQHSKSKELHHDIRRITGNEEGDMELHDSKVMQTDEETESEDGFTIIYDLHDPEGPNKNSTLNRNGLWKVPNFARILTQEEVISEIYG